MSRAVKALKAEYRPHREHRAKRGRIYKPDHNETIEFKRKLETIKLKDLEKWDYFAF